MSETRKLAAIFVSDIVGYSPLAGADEARRAADVILGSPSVLVSQALKKWHKR
jgi:hypothetical protein